MTTCTVPGPPRNYLNESPEAPRTNATKICPDEEVIVMTVGTLRDRFEETALPHHDVVYRANRGRRRLRPARPGPRPDARPRGGGAAPARPRRAPPRARPAPGDLPDRHRAGRAAGPVLRRSRGGDGHAARHRAVPAVSRPCPSAPDPRESSRMTPRTGNHALRA